MANESSYNERGLDCELGFGLRDEALDPWYPWVIPYAGTAYMLLLLQHHNQRVYIYIYIYIYIFFFFPFS